MKAPNSQFTKFRKGALTGVFVRAMKYLGLTIVMVFTVRIIPAVKLSTDVMFEASISTLTVAALALIAAGYAIAAFQFQKQVLELKAESEIDELTGFKNYKALDAELLRLENNRGTDDDPIALILLDIDNFKQLNDEHSYEAADKVLVELGNILRRDSRITDETYRYFLRGDEFLIVARKTNLINAMKAADRKRALIKKAKISVQGVAIDFSVSCGITVFHKGEHKSAVLERLGEAIQKAKKTEGKNTTVMVVAKDENIHGTLAAKP